MGLTRDILDALYEAPPIETTAFPEPLYWLNIFELAERTGWPVPVLDERCRLMAEDGLVDVFTTPPTGAYITGVRLTDRGLARLDRSAG